MSDIDENVKLIKESETFYTTFEPKTVNRFMVKLTDKEGKAIIPIWLIKEVSRPRAQWDKHLGKWTWQPIHIRTYDPIVPSATQMFYEYILEKEPKLFNVTIDVLGPVADTVEKWRIKDAHFAEVDFEGLDWSEYPEDGKSRLEHQCCTRYYKGGGPLQITAEIQYKTAQLIF